MQIVIAMSGFGERFRRAGYSVPKPLIEVSGKPIIAHVVDMFPGDNEFIFICNEDHIAHPEYRMKEILLDLVPDATVLPIKAHKLGPVHAVLQAKDLIDLSKPTVINYCDFTCYWDFEDFARQMEETGCDGAIPAYTGFHPHMTGSTNYAYVKEVNGWVQDIQEKQPYTDTPMEEYASSGTYYYRTGAIALEYCQRVVDEDLNLNGEYYVSLTYKPMCWDGRRIMVYPLQHFFQWGTPQDMAIYNTWVRAFETLNNPSRTAPKQAGAMMLPMAGLGSRFAKEGYTLPKPLVPVSGAPMVVQAARDLPQAETAVYVLRQDLPGRDDVEKAILSEAPNAHIVELEKVTDGQARTCLLGMDKINPDAPMTIGACDNGVLYDADAFEAALADDDADVLVWVLRGHPNAARHPQMYGWVATDGEKVTGISVKTPLEDPETDPIVIGAFTFKKASDFEAAAERMIARDARINDEFYVDTCINDAVELGLKVKIFEVDAFLSWGTPDEYRTFTYWQSCFHKWQSHAYRLENDAHIAASDVAALEAEFAHKHPALPGEWVDPRNG